MLAETILQMNPFISSWINEAQRYSRHLCMEKRVKISSLDLDSCHEICGTGTQTSIIIIIKRSTGENAQIMLSWHLKACAECPHQSHIKTCVTSLSHFLLGL